LSSSAIVALAEVALMAASEEIIGQEWEGALPRAGRVVHGAPGEPPPRHVASRRLHRPQLIGFHAESQESTRRWLGIDSDNHDLDAVGADPASPVYLIKARLSWPGQATGPAPVRGAAGPAAGLAGGAEPADR
jgi:hypothetical protein